MKKIFLSILCLFIITGCGDKKNTPTEPDSDTSVEEKDSTIDTTSKSRPLAIMINNAKPAQVYQTGLNDAYIVYEMVAEGGITRMMALFRDSNIKNVGTIRSSRPYYLDYVLENDAIYVHFGGSEKALNEIKTLGINNIDGMNNYFYWREDFPVATEHTVYSSMEKINNAIDKKGYRRTLNQDLLLKYEDVDLSKIKDSKKATNVKIKYSDYQTNDFTYDENRKLYVKKSNGTIRKDYKTGKEFTVKNIITYQIHNYTSEVQGGGRQEFENIGSGEGYYITNGYAVKIKWKKDSRSGKTKYTYLDGTEIKVNNGNTYIQIQPKGQNLEITSN